MKQLYLGQTVLPSAWDRIKNRSCRLTKAKMRDLVRWRVRSLMGNKVRERLEKLIKVVQ